MAHPSQQDIYGDNARPDVVPFLPDGAGSVLDVGCGRGGFGRALRGHYGPDARIVGVEAVAAQAERARDGHGFDRVLDGYFPDVFHGSQETFDLITFNDVLEHIVDPWAVLRQCHQRLTTNGRVLATIPNVAYAPVIWGLARGRWDYVDAGVLDRTHVRFFTRASMISLMEDSGYVVESCVGVNSISRPWSTDPFAPRRMLKGGVARALGDRRFLHFVLVGSPRTDGETSRPALA